MPRNDESSTPPPHTAQEIMQQEVDAYKAALPQPDLSWPVGVRELYGLLNGRLFDLDVGIEELREACGMRDHNLSSRFGAFVGLCPKAYRRTHRLAMAKQLLCHSALRRTSILQVSMALGYARHQSFTTAFRRYEGCTPSEFKNNSLGRTEK